MMKTKQLEVSDLFISLSSLAAAAGKVDPEPRHSSCERLAAFGKERRHLLGRRDVGVVFDETAPANACPGSSIHNRPQWHQAHADRLEA
jgi:hypothetical protein